MKRLRLEVKDAGSTENEPDWFVPPMGGSPVRTRRSMGIKKQLRTLSASQRRSSLKAGAAAIRGTAM